jgi:hypothetical protein
LKRAVRVEVYSLFKPLLFSSPYKANKRGLFLNPLRRPLRAVLQKVLSRSDPIAIIFADFCNFLDVLSSNML